MTDKSIPKSWIDTPESSNIARFAYDNARGILTVEFKRGGTYDYHDVPSTVFEEMKEAKSKGRFLSESIKPIYRCEKEQPVDTEGDS